MSQGEPSTPSILKELCRHLCSGVPQPTVSKIYHSALRQICNVNLSTLSASLDSSGGDNDEFIIVERVKNQLTALGYDDNGMSFDSLHRKLLRVSQDVLMNRTAVLQFLLKMSIENVRNGNIHMFSEVAHKPFSMHRGSTSPASSFSKEFISSERLHPSANQFISFTPPRSSKTQSDMLSWVNGHSKDTTHSSEPAHSESSGMLNRQETSSSFKFQRFSSSPQQLKSRTTATTRNRPATDSQHGEMRPYNKFEVSETAILKELVYCFQGIEGKIIKMDTQQGFKFDPSARIPQPHLVKHLMELGYLHNRIKELCEMQENRGAVAQGLVYAIRSDLTDYYRTIANLQSELQQRLSLSEDSPMCEETLIYSRLTLQRLLVWSQDPLWHMQCLYDICNQCLNKRGGAVISAAYLFLHHGDPSVQKIVTRILSAATRPLFKLMCHWIIEGELMDPHDEFFVSINTSYLEKNRWRDKYILREDLIPAMMTNKQAMMVLNAGKSINFLNEICGHKMEIKGARAKLRFMEDSEEGDLLSLAEPSSELSQIIETAFMEASQLVLETLKSKFKLYENFQGLRRYMLMRQGDFYRYFMQMLEPELRKPATSLYQHNLMAIMESAIRSTNAQFEDKEILARISVKLLEPSEDETGWDIFSMDYNVDGPLDTVFRLSEGTYQQMFHFLWRLKRVEYVLSYTWKKQTSMLKKLHRLRANFQELHTVLLQCSLLTSEMVHYVHQVQYYILFEVMECAFESFLKKFNTATSIEEVIEAHEKFLQEIKTKSLQDDECEESKQFSTQLRIINDLILELQNVAERFTERAECELTRRVQYKAQVEAEGTCAELETTHRKKKEEFRTFLTSVKAQMRLLSQSYQDVLKKLLIDLSLQNGDLQLLSTRIDFNEFYKRSEPKLSESMKFRHINNLMDFSVYE